ncbi:Hypothetical protein CFV354_0891 [Campylobacter fetus subsp. venerealis NCTC 10354]|nr:Hypothetical protein CFV354_0891 [Campylobacter fetus subsp. venerealis NCTC 10354]
MKNIDKCVEITHLSNLYIIIVG